MRTIPLESIRDAADHMYDVAVRTPLVRLDLPFASPDGPQVFLKLESLQPIGSFKLRGAWNAIRRLPPEAMKDGVWTVSAGNAAQGVAFAARRAGVPCSVMVMDTAPATKIKAIDALGASIVRVTYDEAWRTVESHQSDRMRGHFVHPFDDDDFIAGNATAGLEILEDLPDVDAVVASLGGGGLLAGIGSVMRTLKPGVRVIAAEPETASPLATSLARGEASYFDGWTASFVDGAGGKSVLPSMWPLLRVRGGRVHRHAARRCGGGDALRGRPRPRHRRGRRRVRDCRGAQRARGARQGRGRGLRRQHRPVAICRTGRRGARGALIVLI